MSLKMKVAHEVEHGFDLEFRVLNNTNGHNNERFGMAEERNWDMGR